ncbi:sensor histidine kinase [Paenibacillus cymbidii]|uniref:sensor histidine kinase n=1 Tax=Paenibacillus cymbidii TaxID=1639034 RepID=UPI001081EDE3|nr:sensor histidine kinase [Paenibacillus cymbidii]
MRSRKGWKLITVIVLSLFILLPVLLQAYILGNQFTTKIERLYDRSISKNMDSLSINLDFYINHFEDNLRAYAKDTELLEALQSLSQQVGRPKIEMKLRSFADAYGLRVPLNVALIDKTGQVYSDSTLLEDEEESLRQTVRSFSWYDDNIKYDKNVIYYNVAPDFHSHLRRNGIVYIVKNLVNGDEYLGLIVMLINESLIERLLNQIQFSSSTVAFIASRNGSVLFASGDTKEISTEIANQAIVPCSEPGVDYSSTHLEWNHRTYLGSCRSIPYLGWRLVALTPMETFVSERNQTWLYTLLVTGASLFVIIFILYILTKKVMIPILRLAKLVRQFRIHDNAGRYEYRGVEEIEILSTGIGQMLERIQEQFRQIKEDEAQKLNLELNLLQSQIRPHFLHNAINSVRWMAEMKGEKSIAQALIHLASMLNYTLSNYRVIWSTVGEEADYVRSYISFQGIRMIKPIDATIAIDPGAQHVPIPKLTLQPFVENAILHGFTALDGRMPKLAIRCERMQDDLVFSIEDNGVGMTEETVNRILAEADEREERRTDSGIGIRNVIRRLRLKFGERFQLQIESEPGAGSTFVLRIPYSEREEGEAE